MDNQKLRETIETEPLIVAMVVHKDVLYVATSKGIYAKDGNGNFIPLPIK